MSARFGTDPFIWNWAMWLIARLVPRQFLQDRSQVSCGFCVGVRCVCVGGGGGATPHTPAAAAT